MVRNQYSYWLTAAYADANAKHNATLEDVLAELEKSELHKANNGPMVFEIDPTHTTVDGEVEPDWGCVEEDTSLRTEVQKISVKFPEFNFRFEEHDEEDHANMLVTIFNAGKEVMTANSRIVEAGTNWDEITVREIAKYLDDTGRPKIATEIRNKFKD